MLAWGRNSTYLSGIYIYIYLEKISYYLYRRSRGRCAVWFHYFCVGAFIRGTTVKEQRGNSLYIFLGTTLVGAECCKFCCFHGHSAQDCFLSSPRNGAVEVGSPNRDKIFARSNSTPKNIGNLLASRPCLYFGVRTTASRVQNLRYKLQEKTV